MQPALWRCCSACLLLVLLGLHSCVPLRRVRLLCGGAAAPMMVHTAGLQAGEITAAVSEVLRIPEASLRVHFKLMGNLGYALQPCSPLERFAPGSRVLVTSASTGVAAPRP